MFCRNCGNQMNEIDKFCKKCGTPVREVDIKTNIQPQGNDIFQDSTNEPMFQERREESQVHDTTVDYNSTVNTGSQSSKTVKNIVVAVIAVLLVGVLGFCIFKVYSGNNDTSNEIASTNTYKVDVDGFTFSIPDDMYYTTRNGYLSVLNKEGTWIANIKVLEGSYSTFKKNMSKITAAGEKEGYDVRTPKVKKLGGLEYITIEVDNSGTQLIVAYSKINYMYVAGVEAFTKDLTIDYDILTKIAPVIKSAKKSSSSYDIVAPDSHLDPETFIQYME